MIKAIRKLALGLITAAGLAALPAGAQAGSGTVAFLAAGLQDATHGGTWVVLSDNPNIWYCIVKTDVGYETELFLAQQAWLFRTASTATQLPPQLAIFAADDGTCPGNFHVLWLQPN
jgi:hypothetical protein